MSVDETRSTPDDAADERTDMPGLATWPSVYMLVIVVTLVYVVLLVALQKVYS